MITIFNYNTNTPQNKTIWTEELFFLFFFLSWAFVPCVKFSQQQRVCSQSQETVDGVNTPLEVMNTAAAAELLAEVMSL